MGEIKKLKRQFYIPKKLDDEIRDIARNEQRTYSGQINLFILRGMNKV